MPGKWRGLADAAAQLRGSADHDGAAGLIPYAEAEARRTAALILEDWQAHVTGEETGQ